uniref:Saccharopine dehydrogenase b n=1 Tax=Salmo trutta TaxID=8032 RepID=A0A673VYR3_SALTR
MLTVTSARPDNIIIFGASGFNRQFVMEEAQSAEDPSGSLKWALAGQSRQWLEGGLNQASKSDAPYQTHGPPCQQGLVVLNCVGPCLYGSVVLRSIVPGENAAGSPQQSGVIGSCGFDSIPADMSFLYTRDQFKGRELHFQSFLQCSFLPCKEAVTWKSAIYGFADSGSLRKLRKKFGHQPLPIVGAKVKKRYCLFLSKQIVQHAISFIGSDSWVVRRSQRFLYEEESTLRCNTTTNLDPLDLTQSAGIQLLNNATLLSWLCLFMVCPVSTQFFAYYYYYYHLRLDYHWCTSFVLINYVDFDWSTEPGSVATPVAMVQATITILNEPQFLPINPGAAFARTTLINRLSRHGLVFSVKRF